MHCHNQLSRMSTIFCRAKESQLNFNCFCLVFVSVHSFFSQFLNILVHRFNLLNKTKNYMVEIALLLFGFQSDKSDKGCAKQDSKFFFKGFITGSTRIPYKIKTTGISFRQKKIFDFKLKANQFISNKTQIKTNMSFRQ